MEDPAYAKDYAIFVLKKRWPEAEPSIKNNEGQWDSYKDYFGIEEED